MPGLARRLSRRHAAAIALGTLLGAGLLYVPKRVENLVGPATPLAYVVATLGVCAVAGCYAVFLSSPLGERSGGAYLALSRTWGSRAVGVLCVWPSVAAYVALVGLLAHNLGDTLTQSGIGLTGTQWSVLLLAATFVVHAVGPRRVGRLQVVLTGTFVAAVVALSVAGVTAAVPGNFTPLFPTPALGARPLAALADGALVALFGFVGVDVVATVAGDVRDSRETLPALVVGSVVAAGALATLAAAVTLGVIPWTRLVFVRAPFVAAAASALGVSPAGLLSPLVAVGVAGSLLALPWAPSRLLYALSEVVPPLARTNRFGAPDLALVLTFGGAAALVVTDTLPVALFLALSGLCLQYVAVALSVAALPVVRPRLYDRCTWRPAPFVLVGLGLSAAGVMGALLWQTVVVDPVVALGYARVGPAVSPSLADALFRDPRRSVVPALVVWETIGVLVVVAARDYREEMGVEREPLAATYDDAE